MSQMTGLTDAARLQLGFLSLEATVALASRDILIPDPASVLVSPSAKLGKGVILWPGVIVECSSVSDLSIGDGTALLPGTRIVASNGTVMIGHDVEIGEEGGFTIKAESGAVIEIGDGARLLGGGSLTMANRIGRGAQILGPIRCRNCRLGDGGDYRHPEPDERGGVLKGSGVAHDIHVEQGHVIQAFGLFSEGIVRRQSYFHPKAGR